MSNEKLWIFIDQRCGFHLFHRWDTSILIKTSLILTPEPVSVFQSSIGSSTLYLWSCFSSGVIFVSWSCSLLSFHSLSLINVYPLGFEWVAYGKMSLFLFWGWAQSQDHLVISPSWPPHAAPQYHQHDSLMGKIGLEKELICICFAKMFHRL